MMMLLENSWKCYLTATARRRLEKKKHYQQQAVKAVWYLPQYDTAKQQQARVASRSLASKRKRQEAQKYKKKSFIFYVRLEFNT